MINKSICTVETCTDESHVYIEQLPAHSTMEGWAKGMSVLTDIYEREGLKGISQYVAKERESAERRGREKAVEYIRASVGSSPLAKTPPETMVTVYYDTWLNILHAARKDTDV